MSRARSSGVRRLLQEASELEQDKSTDYKAAPLEDDLFQWHFTIRGPGAEFEGGIYHGRIVLPSEYPFKPPEIYLSTPSGRFEVNKKICLSISSFHPETWQPSWGIRTALLALSAFFTTEAAGAVGSLDAPPAERKRLAKASRSFKCSTCGFDASTYPEAEEKKKKSDAEVASSEIVSETVTTSTVSNKGEATTIFPPTRSNGAPPPTHTHHKVETSRAPSHHRTGVDIPSNGASGPSAAAAGSAVASPQLPVVQHRPPEAIIAAPGVPPASTSVVLEAVPAGGSPLLIDRLILAVILALIACVVRKFA